MNLLTFSSCFPNRLRPTEGIFVLERMAAVARHADVQVVHPLARAPWRPPLPHGLPPEETIRGLIVHHRPFRYLPGVLKRCDGWFYYHGLAGWTAESCRQRPTDLLDAHFAWPDGVGVSMIARQLKIPYVVTLRGTINPRWPIRCFRRRLAPALRNAAAVISVSRPMADIAVLLGVHASRVHVIPNGVDGELFCPGDRMETRRELGLETDRPLLVCVASLKRAKGQRELLQAAGSIRPLPQVVLVGEAVEGQGYLQELSRIARHSNLDGCVRYTGPVDRATVAAYFRAADLAVLASHGEGCPNALLEALACGTPVVASRVGGIPELVRHGANGLLAPPRNPEALAATLQEALGASWSPDVVRRSVIHRTWDHVAYEVLDVLSAAMTIRV